MSMFPRLLLAACFPLIALEAATASRTTTCHPLLLPTTGCKLRCISLLVFRVDREVQAYPRQAIAYVGAPHLQLLLILHFRILCQVWARLTGAPTMISKRFPLAFWFPPLGLVLPFLVGRRPALLPRAYCAILCPPLGLVLLPLKGWCRTPTSSARLAL